MKSGDKSTAEEIRRLHSLRETLRYLGYKGQNADEQTLCLAEECLDELSRTVSPRYCVREFPLRLAEPDMVDTGVFAVHSSALSKNLKDCRQILFFAATLGTEADRRIRRYSYLEMSRAVVMQAAAAAFLEDFCDRVNENLQREYAGRGLFLRPRFSPGYGDFPLECQKPLLESLDAAKRAGITLTDSFLMSPSKSVSAVIGVSDVPRSCTVQGCEACGKTDCQYRRTD